MWRGFNHVGMATFDDETIAGRKTMLSKPMVNPELVVAATAPDGNYVSHCSMWYQPGDFYCSVEPVVTDPEYRKMGLGKSVVLEAIIRRSWNRVDFGKGFYIIAKELAKKIKRPIKYIGRLIFICGVLL